MININMNIFQMKSKPHGKERISEFIGDSEEGSAFLAIGWPGIGNLHNVGKEEIRRRLEMEYGYKRQQLGTYLGAVNAFVNTIKKDDLVLITNNLDQVLVFKAGDYRYVAKYDNNTDAMCHQREAELLIVLDKADLNSEIQELLRNRGTITQFKYPFEKSGLEKWLNPVASDLTVDLTELVNKSLILLEKELASNDSEIRIKAAAEILQYAKENQ